MKYHAMTRPRFIVDGVIYPCDSITRLTRAIVAETPTTEGRCISRSAGDRPREIIAKGRFVPEDLERFAELIRTFNEGVRIFVVDNEYIQSPVLISGSAGVSAETGLGEFTMRFGVLDNGI